MLRPRPGKYGKRRGCWYRSCRQRRPGLLQQSDEGGTAGLTGQKLQSSLHLGQHGAGSKLAVSDGTSQPQRGQLVQPFTSGLPKSGWATSLHGGGMIRQSARRPAAEPTQEAKSLVHHSGSAGPDDCPSPWKTGIAAAAAGRRPHGPASTRGLADVSITVMGSGEATRTAASAPANLLLHPHSRARQPLSASSLSAKRRWAWWGFSKAGSFSVHDDLGQHGGAGLVDARSRAPAPQGRSA